MRLIISYWRRVTLTALFALVISYIPSILILVNHVHHSHANSHLPDQHLIPHTVGSQAWPIPSTDFTSQITHMSSLVTLKPALHRRAEIDVTFTNLVCKADALIGRIAAAPPMARTYTAGDLRSNGWDYKDNGIFYPNVNIVPALRDLEIPHAINDAKYVQLGQNKAFKRSGTGNQRYPATFGFYDGAYILSNDKSTIIASNNKSPEKAVPPGQTIPELFRWSDLVWYAWTKVAGNQARKLRYIIQENITTNSTRRMMEYIEGIHDRPETLNLPWPGHLLDLRSDRGRALLATPHGVGLAWMIADHSNVIGRKFPVVCYFTGLGSPPFSVFAIEYFMIWQLRDQVGIDNEDPNKVRTCLDMKN